jgi:hypothetical protein
MCGGSLQGHQKLLHIQENGLGTIVYVCSDPAHDQKHFNMEIRQQNFPIKKFD